MNARRVVPESTYRRMFWATRAALALYVASIVLAILLRSWLSTRTMRLNPAFSFLYMNMENHIEHHLYPNVPFHALPEQPRAVRSELPPPYPGLWAAWREMIPGLLRQRRVPEYVIPRPLPRTGSKASAQQPMHVFPI